MVQAVPLHTRFRAAREGPPSVAAHQQLCTFAVHPLRLTCRQKARCGPVSGLLEPAAPQSASPGVAKYQRCCSGGGKGERRRTGGVRSRQGLLLVDECTRSSE